MHCEHRSRGLLNVETSFYNQTQSAGNRDDWFGMRTVFLGIGQSHRGYKRKGPKVKPRLR